MPKLKLDVEVNSEDDNASEAGGTDTKTPRSDRTSDQSELNVKLTSSSSAKIECPNLPTYQHEIRLFHINVVDSVRKVLTRPDDKEKGFLDRVHTHTHLMRRTNGLTEYQKDCVTWIDNCDQRSRRFVIRTLIRSGKSYCSMRRDAILQPDVS